MAESVLGRINPLIFLTSEAIARQLCNNYYQGGKNFNEIIEEKAEISY